MHKIGYKDLVSPKGVNLKDYRREVKPNFPQATEVELRELLQGRDVTAMMHENGIWRFPEPEIQARVAEEVRQALGKKGARTSVYRGKGNLNLAGAFLDQVSRPGENTVNTPIALLRAEYPLEVGQVEPLYADVGVRFQLAPDQEPSVRGVTVYYPYARVLPFGQ